MGLACGSSGIGHDRDRRQPPQSCRQSPRPLARLRRPDARRYRASDHQQRSRPLRIWCPNVCPLTSRRSCSTCQASPYGDHEAVHCPLQAENLRRQLRAKVLDRLRDGEVLHLSLFALEPRLLLFRWWRAQLVPRRPALEQFQGRHVMGILRGRSTSWVLWHGRTPGLPPIRPSADVSHVIL